MPSFHLFGLSGELASTFQPSSFQFAFTAQSTLVHCAIRATAHRVLSGLYLIRDLKVRQRNAPILFLFLSISRARSRLAYLARFWRTSTRGAARKPWPTRQSNPRWSLYMKTKDPPKLRHSGKESEGQNRKRKAIQSQDQRERNPLPPTHPSGTPGEPASTLQPPPSQPAPTAQRSPSAPRT